MGKKEYKQIRYLYDTTNSNSPNSPGATRANLIGGALFNDEEKIISCTISGMLGMGFFINDTPSPIRLLKNGDAVDDYANHCTFTFPQQVLNYVPIYNIKVEAASLDRLIAWNKTHPNAPEYLIIDYIVEAND